VHENALALFAELMELPKTHDALLVQGGASLQFAMLPLNFLKPGASADYLVTGHWAKLALKEAKNLGNARAASDLKEADGSYARIPAAGDISADPKAAYLHLTSNNTIFGTQWREYPDAKGVPLVADMSSDILSRPAQAEKFALIYAGAQKNLGPAGLALVAVNRDWLKDARTDGAAFLRYQTHLEKKSLAHTPPTFAVYLVGLQLAWIKANGGVAGMEKRNEAKAGLLYGTLDRLKGFYKVPAAPEARSRMNAVFRTPSAELDEAFCAEAAKHGMTGLKGHRSAGGVRASLYNAVSPDDVKALAQFAEDFAKTRG
jgi:phosphoserine aminotransferase